MAEDGQGVGSPGAASSNPLTGEAEAVRLLAASSASSKSDFRESKFVRQPEVFDPKDMDQELQQWSDWSFRFRSFMMVQDPRFKEDMEHCESATTFVSFADYPDGMKERAIRLYALLASYLRGRPLKILRSIADSDGFKVWRQLNDELAPKTRPRTLALAQALTRFPPYQEGGSLLEYILSYERLVREYEAISPHAYADDLKIGTLLSGLPGEMRRYLQMQVTETTTYETLRERVLQYERSSSTWNSDHVLKSLGMEQPHDGPTPMEVDRLEKGKPKGGAKKGPKGFGKPSEKWNGKDKGKISKPWGWPGNKQKSKQAGGFKGKGKYGKPSDGGKSKKGAGVCFLCGKPGHFAAECRHNVNQVANLNQSQEMRDDASTTATTSASGSSVLTSATSYAKAKPRIQRINLMDVEDKERGDEELCVTFLNPHVNRLENSEEVAASEEELESSSFLWYRMDSEDAECDMSVHVVQDPSLHEVILDSGADVTVLPWDQFEEVGHESESQATLLDAQGNFIPQGSTRQQVLFEVEGSDGELIQFVDKVVLAKVKQPLFCLGKLLKNRWSPVDRAGVWSLDRDGSSFKTHWCKNSLATFMRISRMSASEAPVVCGDGGAQTPEVPELNLRAVVEIDESLDAHTKASGWSLTADGFLSHCGFGVEGTLDAGALFSPSVWPYRVTLLWREGKKYEVFEGSEEWGPRVPGGPNKYLPFGVKEKKVVTLLSKNPLDLNSLGKFSGADQLRDDQRPVRVEAPRVPPQNEVGVEGNTPGEPPLIGPAPAEVQGDGEEVISVNGTRLTEASSLRDLRVACRFLDLSNNGSKAVVWSRLKKEVAMTKLKAAVSASEEIQKQYEREPLVEALPKPGRVFQPLE